MKLLTCLIVVCACSQACTASLIDDVISIIVNNILPFLAGLEIDKIELGNNNVLTDIKTHNLEKITVDSDTSMIPITINNLDLDLNFTTISGNYSFENLTVQGFELFGEGTFDVRLEGFHLNFGAAMKRCPLPDPPTSFCVKEIQKLSFEFGKVEVELTGLMNSEEVSRMVSSVLSRTGPCLIQSIQSILPEYYDQITTILNKFLVNIDI